MGNYGLEYTENGKDLLLYSDLGHVSIMDWKNKNLKNEFFINQSIK